MILCRGCLIGRRLLELSYVGVLFYSCAQHPHEAKPPVSKPEIPDEKSPSAPQKAPEIDQSKTVPRELVFESTLKSIQKDFVDIECLSCHQSATSKNRDVDLSDLSQLFTDQPSVHTPNQPRKIIRVGCPDESMFYISLKNNQMPVNPDRHLSPKNKDLVRNWILSLSSAPVTDCSDEPSDFDLRLSF
jgi:hypothetical protein